MAEDNLILAEDLAKVQNIDFVYRFKENIDKLTEALGITRKIALQAGSVLKMYRTSGTLADGDVDEGDLIPLSAYENELVSTKELEFLKWRKATSLEAIAKRGYQQAVGDTDDKMLSDIQKTIRTQLFDALADGTATASGTNFQKALANAWGTLSVAFEDFDADPVYFVNPLDIADYLGNAQVTMQTAFGMSYIENFIGLGTVFVNSSVPQAKVYATAKDNLVMYYCPAGEADIARMFDFNTDESGYIMVAHNAVYNNATAETIAVSGITFFPEYIDKIVVGTIEEAIAPYAQQVIVAGGVDTRETAVHSVAVTSPEVEAGEDGVIDVTMTGFGAFDKAFSIAVTDADSILVDAPVIDGMSIKFTIDEDAVSTKTATVVVTSLQDTTKTATATITVA